MYMVVVGIRPLINSMFSRELFHQLNCICELCYYTSGKVDIEDSDEFDTDLEGEGEAQESTEEEELPKAPNELFMEVYTCQLGSLYYAVSTSNVSPPLSKITLS